MTCPHCGADLIESGVWHASNYCVIHGYRFGSDGKLRQDSDMMEPLDDTSHWRCERCHGSLNEVLGEQLADLVTDDEEPDEDSA